MRYESNGSRGSAKQEVSILVSNYFYQFKRDHCNDKYILSQVMGFNRRYLQSLHGGIFGVLSDVWRVCTI